MKTVYVETPISETPEVKLTHGHWMPYFTDKGELYWDGMNFRTASHQVVSVIWWLKPVPVSGVPSDIQIGDYVGHEHLENYDQNYGCGIGMRKMRDLMLPSLAALTAENEVIKIESGVIFKRLNELSAENKALSQERDRMKELLNDLFMFTDNKNNILNGFRTHDIVTELKSILKLK